MPDMTLIIVFSALLPIVLVAVIVGSLMRGQAKTDTLLRTGMPARGRILQLGTTGGSVAVMGHRHLKLVFTVEVHPQMGAPYVANFQQLVSELQVPSVQPGAMIELRIDPKNPANMAMAGVGGSPPGMQPGMHPGAQQQGQWGAPQQPFGGPQPMGQPGYGAAGMPPQGFAQPVMGVAQPNYKSALPFIIFMVFITTVPTAVILLYVFGSFGSSSSSSKDSEDEEIEEEDKPKKSKASDTCKKAVKCCKVVAQGQAAAVAACENWEKNSMEAACQSALDGYKQGAAALKKPCD